MADFDAGSIVGSMKLDTDAFAAGLDKAAADADRWEADHKISLDISPNVNQTEADASIEELKAKMAGLGGGEANTSVGINDTGFEAERLKLQAEIDRLSAERPKVTIGANVAAAIAGLTALKSAEKDASGEGSGSGLAGHGMMFLIGSAIALAPAFAPAIAAIGLFGSAALAGMAQAGLGIAAFAAVAKTDFGTISAAAKAGLNLTGPAGQAETALKGVQTAWKGVIAATSGPVFGVMTKALNDAAGLLPKIVPLVNAVATGLSGAVGQINKSLSGPAFAQFLAMVEKDAVPDIKAMTGALINFGTGAMNIIEGLNPVSQILAGSIGNLSKEFLSWSQSMKNGGIEEIFNYVKANGPAVGSLLHSVFSTLGDLGKDLAPLVGPALTFLTSLVKAIGEIKLAPLAGAFGMLLSALAPVLPMIASLVNTLLPPLTTILGVLVTGFIEPLVKSLGAELQPVLGQVGGALGQLAGPLGTFLNSIANLVNPTGVGFLVTLISGLLTVVMPLVPSVLALATAFESVVDDGLAAITPLIGPLATALGGVARGIAPVVQGFADLMSHKAAADTLLALAAGIFAIQKAMAVGAAITTFIGLLKGITVAEGSATAATKAYNLVLSAGKAWSAVTSGAAAVAGAIGKVSAAMISGITQAAKWIASMVAQGAAMVATAAKTVATTAVRVGLAVATGVVTAATWLWTAATTAAGVAMDILLGPIGLIILAAVALGLGIYELVKHWSNVEAAMKEVAGYIGGAFLTAWHAVETFFEGLGAKIASIFSGCVTWLEGAGKDIIHGLLVGIEAYFTLLWDVYVKYPLKFVQAFAGAVGWLVGAGKDIIQGLFNGITNLWGTVSSWLGGIGGKILSALGNLGGVLVAAGGALMGGLLSGITAGFDKIKGFVGGIASWIGAHKGPLDYDRQLLVPHGNAIMDGLHQGLTDSFTQKIVPFISGAAAKLSGISADMNTNLTMTSTASMATTQAEQATLLARLSDAVVELARAIDGQTSQPLAVSVALDGTPIYDKVHQHVKQANQMIAVTR